MDGNGKGNGQPVVVIVDDEEMVITSIRAFLEPGNRVRHSWVHGPGSSGHVSWRRIRWMSSSATI